MSHHVYIMATPCRRRLHVGATNSLHGRVALHRDGFFGMHMDLAMNRLVYTEAIPTAELARNRRNEIRSWPKERKEALIEGENPSWDDLAADWGLPHASSPSLEETWWGDEGTLTDATDVSRIPSRIPWFAPRSRAPRPTSPIDHVASAPPGAVPVRSAADEGRRSLAEKGGDTLAKVLRRRGFGLKLRLELQLRIEIVREARVERPLDDA
jgi:putative endonuclease